jgi:High potential iron-sulfur protein
MPGPSHPIHRQTGLVNRLTRRTLLPALLGSAAMFAAALSLGGGMADAQSKTAKKTAKYQDHPNNGQSCSQCNFFRPPKSCQLVEGDISPNGWCSFWAKKA